MATTNECNIHLHTNGGTQPHETFLLPTHVRIHNNYIQTITRTTHMVINSLNYLCPETTIR